MWAGRGGVGGFVYLPPTHRIWLQIKGKDLHSYMPAVTGSW